MHRDTPPSPGRKGRNGTNEETSRIPHSDTRRIANRRGEGNIFNDTPKRSLSADRSGGRPSFDDAASPFVNDLLPGRDSNLVYGNEDATEDTDMPEGKEEESGGGDKDGQGGKRRDQGWLRYDGVSRVFIASPRGCTMRKSSPTAGFCFEGRCYRRNSPHNVRAKLVPFLALANECQI